MNRLTEHEIAAKRTLWNHFQEPQEMSYVKTTTIFIEPTDDTKHEFPSMRGHTVPFHIFRLPPGAMSTKLTEKVLKEQDEDWIDFFDANVGDLQALGYPALPPELEGVRSHGYGLRHPLIFIPHCKAPPILERDTCQLPLGDFGFSPETDDTIRSIWLLKEFFVATEQINAHAKNKVKQNDVFRDIIWVYHLPEGWTEGPAFRKCFARQDRTSDGPAVRCFLERDPKPLPSYPSNLHKNMLWRLVEEHWIHSRGIYSVYERETTYFFQFVPFGYESVLQSEDAFGIARKRRSSGDEYTPRNRRLEVGDLD